MTTSKCILIIDDTVEYRWMMTVILEGAGYTCNEASSGEEALIMLRDGCSPSLIITDLHMGPGLSGVELLSEVRDVPACRDIPIVLASCDPYSGKIAREAGFTAALDKGNLSSHLLPIVDALLPRKSILASATCP